jgi:hypothetical protein
MKKHTVIFALLAILLIAILLAGCGGGGDTQTTSTTGTTTSPTGTTTSPTGTTTSPTVTTTTPAETTPTNTGIPLSQTLGLAAKYPTVKYDMITTVTNMEAVTVKYWIKNQKIRIESESYHMILLMDFADQTMYMYLPAQNMATKMVFDANQAPEAPSTMLEYSPKIVGTETIDGETCTVIEYTYEQAITKTWIWNDKGFPLKMESSASGVTTTIEWKNFDFSDIPDSTFELPDGVQIIGLSG